MIRKNLKFKVIIMSKKENLHKKEKEIKPLSYLNILDYIVIIFVFLTAIARYWEISIIFIVLFIVLKITEFNYISNAKKEQEEKINLGD